MKKLLLLLFCTPLFAHNPKHITSTDSVSRAKKAHKVQQVRSAKKAILLPWKKLETKLSYIVMTEEDMVATENASTSQVLMLSIAKPKDEALV